MPGIDGVAATAHQSLDTLRDIPVIVVTAKTALGDLQAAFARRGDGLHYETGEQRGIARPGQFRAHAQKGNGLPQNRELELRRTANDLQRALREVKVLKDLVPICAPAKNPCNDQASAAIGRIYPTAFQRRNSATASALHQKALPGVYPD